LLEHISIDLGLDDLTIIDLRNLDPPPALGADLIMVLGTARSEKHLHVSADRLCRWLRSNHGLSPFADGLLGRNELKLKLKRKARRSKLLGSVGAPERGGMDDGVRTGWICVNAGRVEGAGNGIDEAAAVDGFVGFGSRSRGVRLVMQMLTEEKRKELDLESLWGGMVARKARRDAKTEELVKRAAEGRTTERHVDTGVREISNVPPTQVARFKSPATRHQVVQTRSLHTPARHLAGMPPALSSDTLENYTFPVARPDESAVSRKTLNESILQSLASEVDAGNYRSVCRILRNIDPWVLKKLVDDGGKELLLRAHLNHLRSLPHRKALGLLGDSPSTDLSSPFLFSFHQSLPAFPDRQHWRCHVELLCYGMELGHRRCTKSGLMMLFSHLCLSGVEIPVTTFLTILQSLLSKNGILTDKSYYGQEKWSSDIQMALHVLEEMSHRGHDILTEDIFVLLLERVSRPDADEISSNAMTAKRRLNDIIFAYDIPLTKEESLLRILPLYADQGDWNNFWLLWKEIAMRALRRTEALYALMFRSVAKTSNQVQCMRALRMRVPDMEIEEPPVSLTGDVALAVKECLVVADPWVSQDAQKVPLVDGEWTRLWRRCEYGLRQSTH
jgi:hypothetical protein